MNKNKPQFQQISDYQKPRNNKSDIDAHEEGISSSISTISQMPYVYKVNSNFGVLSNSESWNMMIDEFSDIVLDSTPHLKLPEECIRFFKKNPFMFYSSRGISRKQSNKRPELRAVATERKGPSPTYIALKNDANKIKQELSISNFYFLQIYTFVFEISMQFPTSLSEHNLILQWSHPPIIRTCRRMNILSIRARLQRPPQHSQLP